MASSSIPKLAVLIDADNAQPAMAGAVFAKVAKYGTAFMRQAYGNWASTGLKGWKSMLLTQSIVPIQQFAYTQGKNANDSAMIIDAMDLLYTNRFKGFCLVSSDSDFTRLAMRIRESGLNVYGFGQRQTPKAFVSACDEFIYIENIANNKQLTAPQACPAIVAPPHEGTTSTVKGNKAGLEKKLQKAAELEKKLQKAAELEEKLQKVVAAASDNEGWANLSQVGTLITKQFPDFDPQSFGFGFSKLSKLVVAVGSFHIDRRTIGEGKEVDIYVRDKRLKRKISQCDE